jgi:hypothetical protein
MTKNNTRVISLLACLGFLFFSCATKPEAYRDIDYAVDRNDFEEAIEAIKKGQEKSRPIYPEKNAISLFLDKGLLEHYAGNYANSSQDLQEAERLIEEAFTKSITADLASYILNDNTKEYPGEDFEDIYINVFNALNYYNRGNLEGAMVEIRKLTLSSGKLNMLERKYVNANRSANDGMENTLNDFGVSMNDALPQGGAVNYSNSALARYLSALFYLGDRDADGFRIEMEQLQAAFASNRKIYYHPFPKSIADVRTVPDGKTRLNVIGFTGLSPIKEEGTFYQFFPFFNNMTLQRPAFKLPMFVKRPSKIDRIEVVIGMEKFNLELLEDMGAVIEETYNARFAQIFLKTYIRTLLKYAAIDIAATKAGRQANSVLVSEASALAAKKAFDVTESADIRMSRYLPDKAYIGGINLEPGNYTVVVHYYSQGRIIAREERDVNVRTNALNLIQMVCLR